MNVEFLVAEPQVVKASILDLPTNYDKNPNRLANVRWPVGEDPGQEGTSERDGQWINVKLDVTEHPDPDPDQRDLLGGGPALRLNCGVCGSQLHIAAEKDAVEVLQDAGIGYRGDEAHKTVSACVCARGHLTQLWSDMAERLIERREMDNE